MKNLRIILVILVLGSILLLSINKVDVLCPPQKFEEISVEINDKVFLFDKADTSCQIGEGLSNRTELRNDGMIFILPTEDSASVYLEKTFIPLTIAYIDSKGKILEIQNMSPNLSPINVDLYMSSSNKVKYTIQAFYGFFEKNNIKVGDYISYE